MIEVRPARPGDGAILVEMAHSLAASHDELSHFTATADGFESALFCNDPFIGAVIAFVDGVPAGSAIWHRSFSTFRGREIMYLEDVSVLESFRRRGVAKALMSEIARVALARGYDHIFWMVMDWNDGAQKLYEQLGASLEPGYQVARIRGDALERLAR